VNTPPLDGGALVAPLLHALRLVPVAALSPFLGGPLVPAPLRLLVACGLGTAAWLLMGARPAPAEGLALMALGLRELALGAGLRC
jgi:type III secretory pathway component EscT